MISGMFHIQNPRYKFKDFLKKALKLFAVYMLWEAVYVFVANKPLEIKSFVAPHYHLWFLPMISLMYLLTPLFNLWINKVKSVLVYVVITFLIGGYALFTGTVVKNLTLWSVVGCASYYLMRYLLHQTYREKDKWVSFVVFVLGALSTILGTWYLSAKQTAPVEIFYSYAMPNVVIGSMALFILFTHVNTVVNEKTYKILLSLSNLSFGVYLIHPIFIALLHDSPLLDSQPIVKCILIVVVSLFASWGLSYLISKVPYLSKIILR
jgi:surface polysaccharide O-acyltransferase-like enzyme